MSVMPFAAALSMPEKPAALPGTIAQLVSHRNLNGAVLNAGLVGATMASAGERFLLVHRPGAEFIDRLPFNRAERLEHDFDWFRPASLRRLLDDLRRHGVTAMHSHSGDAHITGALLRAFGGPALVQTVHARIPHWHWWMADQVICPSAGANIFMRRLAVPRQRLSIIVNFLDNACLLPDMTCSSLRRELGLGDEAFVILCAASLEQNKNQGALVDVLPHLLAAGIDAHLLLAGRIVDAYGRVGWNTWQKRAPGHIHLLGERRDIDALLAACDVFALPSFREEAPLAIIEAMRAERPVVATRVGAIPDLVAEGKTGTLISLQQTGDLARALLAYAGDRALRERHGKAGRARFEECFSTAGAVAALTDTYQAARARRLASQYNHG